MPHPAGPEWGFLPRGHSRAHVDRQKQMRLLAPQLRPRHFDLAAPTELSMSIPDRIAGMQAEVAAWRRDIHAHPEILFDVHRTAASVTLITSSGRMSKPASRANA